MEIAIGDAYGAGFEFCAREKIDRLNTLGTYVAPDHGGRAGRYTDDTQMSIANSEVLLSQSVPTSEDFASAYVQCYRRDPRYGYAKGFRQLLEQCDDGAMLMQRIHPWSRRNGAAMRSVPLGLFRNKAKCMLVARCQAAVTHNTTEGILSSQVVALMTHSLLHDNAALTDLANIIRCETGFELRDNWQASVECDAIQTLHAVNTALLANRSLSALLLACVEFGGDVDSVASIALGLASISPEYIRDLPARLIDGLEAGAYGRDFLLRIDAALERRFPELASQTRPSQEA